MESDHLIKMWALQAQQQRELGLDPNELSDVERRRLCDDLTLQMHEEVSELGRLSGGYKRHILRAPKTNLGAVGIECADVLKTLFCIAQLHGLTPGEMVDAFVQKTNAVRQKAVAEQLELTNSCRVLCVDVDDVICDLEPWRDELKKLGPIDAAAALRLEASEDMKNAFYSGGRFREMSAVPGAAEGLARIAAAGIKIVLITARPQWQYKRLHSDTVYWLNREGITYDLLLFSRNKVEAVYDHVRPAWPIAFVEDHPVNADAIAEAGIQVLLYDQPHNRHVSAKSGITRVASWTEITTKLGV